MLLDAFRSHTATVERTGRTSDGVGGWLKSAVTAGSVVGSLQPGGGGDTEAAGQERSKVGWSFFCDVGADVRRDDVLVIGDGRYRVVNVQTWQALSAIDHLHVDLEQIQTGE